MTEAPHSTSPDTKPRPTAEPDLDRAVTQMLQRPAASSVADRVREMAVQHEGLTPYPTEAPMSLLAIEAAIPLEAERLLDLARGEYARLYPYQSEGKDDAGRQEVANRLRRRFRIRELEAVIEPPPAAPEEDADADLLAIERKFVELDDAAIALSQTVVAVEEAMPAIAMPAALRVQRHDWIYTSLPLPKVVPDGEGRGRWGPYGRSEVEFLRANPCMAATFGGTEGEEQEDGSRLRPDGPAQKRADEIIAAWDRWQAEIGAAEEAAGIPEMEARHRALIQERDAVLQRMREMSARTLAGLAAKARVAVSMGVIEENLKAFGLRYREAVDVDAFLFDVAGDVLNLVGDTLASAEAGKPATVDETALLEFEGYTLDGPVLSPAEWHETLRPHAFGLYLSGRLVRMSKREAVRFLSEATAKSPDSISTMLDTLTAMKGSFKGWAQLAELAEARFMIAGSALAVEMEAADRG